ncbi:MAG: MarR family transcriptional regulator [Bacteroidia bacterium]|nr:MarR family transcriptional regulator [Bacteroidia bacterium]MCO5253035.1 MarR family transcriptional regulator [Bacteroidota bacterium]MCZ2131015.1 MarR family transcriptional regulator [Bacteroidia bacterium]
MSIVNELNLRKETSELHKAHLNILFTSGIVHNRVANILKPYGITVEQFNVLRILRGAVDERLCIKDIASRMIDRNSNVSRIVDKLETHKQIVRSQSETDKRASHILLTDLGLKLVTEIANAVQSDLNNVLNLTEDEAQLLNNLLDKARHC